MKNHNVNKEAAELMQGVSVELLKLIVSGHIDLKLNAQNELSKRGLNEKGEWVGYGN